MTCNPPGDIVSVVTNARSTLGGYVKLALESVAGPGILTGVGIRSPPAAVRACAVCGVTDRIYKLIAVHGTWRSASAL